MRVLRRERPELGAEQFTHFGRSLDQIEPLVFGAEAPHDVLLVLDATTGWSVAQVPALIPFPMPLKVFVLSAGATGLFLKGQDAVEDMREAARYWEYEADVVPSLSDERGRIVRVRRLGRARKV